MLINVLIFFIFIQMLYTIKHSLYWFLLTIQLTYLKFVTYNKKKQFDWIKRDLFYFIGGVTINRPNWLIDLYIPTTQPKLSDRRK